MKPCLSMEREGALTPQPHPFPRVLPQNKGPWAYPGRDRRVRWRVIPLSCVFFRHVVSEMSSEETISQDAFLVHLLQIGPFPPRVLWSSTKSLGFLCHIHLALITTGPFSGESCSHLKILENSATCLASWSLLFFFCFQRSWSSLLKALQHRHREVSEAVIFLKAKGRGWRCGRLLIQRRLLQLYSADKCNFKRGSNLNFGVKFPALKAWTTVRFHC